MNNIVARIVIVYKDKERGKIWDNIVRESTLKSLERLLEKEKEFKLKITSKKNL